MTKALRMTRGQNGRESQHQTEAQRSGFGLEKEEGSKGYGACGAGGMDLLSSDAGREKRFFASLRMTKALRMTKESLSF